MKPEIYVLSQTLLIKKKKNHLWKYEKECVYMYNWITLLYSGNYLNTVNQLYFNKKYR